MRILVIIAVVLTAALIIFFIRVSPHSSVTKEADDAPSTFMNERIRLKTNDNVAIVGDYYPADGKSGVLLLHMMPADRKSWVLFAEKLHAAGFSVLAIDLRGHGESEGGPDGYKRFSDTEHQQSRFDVEAATEFFRSKGITELHLAGASIGANLALEYLANHPDAKSAILLSPGLDYRGIHTEPFVQKVSPDTGIFLVASEDDAYSRDTVQKLGEHISFDEKHQMRIFSNAGHGTTIFEQNPKFMDELAEWLQKI